MRELLRQLNIETVPFINVPHEYNVGGIRIPAISNKSTMALLDNLYRKGLRKSPNQLLEDGFLRAFDLVDQVGWEEAVKKLDRWEIKLNKKLPGIWTELESWIN